MEEFGNATPASHNKNEGFEDAVANNPALKLGQIKRSSSQNVSI
jgi:hypothetical protein